ncbi:MAG: hypothetical protein IK130_07155 [Oscillospiraceae bacterium]|nr:hypothetical protein [Oscillospiraceae bacterium]
METSFWWVFDAMCAVIAAYVIFSNGKRGFTKVLVASIGYVVAVLLASVLAFASSSALYESVARPSDLSAIELVNSKAGEYPELFYKAIEAQNVAVKIDKKEIEQCLRRNPKEFDKELRLYVGNKGGIFSSASRFEETMRSVFITHYGEQLAERMPRYVQMNFAKQVDDDPAIAGTIMEAIYNPKLSSKDAAAVIEDMFAKEPTQEVLQIFVYLIVFCILMVFAALISAALEYKLIFSFNKAADHALGALLGIVETLALLIFFTIAVRLVVQLGGGTLLCFNDPTIARSKVFSFFYDHISILL